MRGDGDNEMVTATTESCSYSPSTDSGYEHSDNSGARGSLDNGTPGEEMAVVAKKPLSRRGHFKSRLGCFNCKRRRVKCNELRPSCTPCARLKLGCSYPTASAPATTSVRANPSVLAFEDLRFYHQFLTTAFPTLPLRSDSVWQQCAAMSHQVGSVLCKSQPRT